MSLSNLAIAKTDDLPIRHEGDVHSGKVRSVYWLTMEDSARIIEQRGYQVSPGTQLAVMVISDRISAYEIIWQGEDGLQGVPGKGASLNATALHWFEEFEKAGLAGNHILESPHPLVWIVQKAQPVMVEGIARQYITGSMWRSYANGGREICGIPLPDGLENGQKLDELLITPSTKGILSGIPGVPEKDDVDVTRDQILDNYQAFEFHSPEDVSHYEKLLAEGFNIIADQADEAGQLLVDTKFEFGYIPNPSGDGHSMIYIDEVGTLDSSRFWDKDAYADGNIVENSKEMFRKFLCDAVPEADVLLNKERMEERVELGNSFKVPVEALMATSELYKKTAEQLTGKPMPEINNARQEILDSLSDFGIVD
ncbi:phosphoribosylaminoimidazolesuccinocarboxamide synthase [Verrucomicrobiaceae bacterium R5-34]|uniref:Phosphoribosylaminoimidazole-succinocarboxamide synthase n=1 Tax=Oceaniferula flava TaxID=2800421 RepID=A0AAE2SG52_9BACT|nr:phosphoribosylaminoimidazolesuccinocarboxamide synthase [Oceaniferula flavus]MBK1830910.1 phosphoribosylaminoimidazolesuccinocarboxamide synthase [Verrucomicrobiaceae bacterium R5-34]MBK1855756.1 phosphoribosylaminoimidazolesuccinocarboxamide synthase [Oceaniferula flavus]MBM1137063.1 phosphoribosylaminoimidazolesuccinocarboxamide synthase [Oceaniferula flavus]